MHLSELHIQGFKSFARTSDLSFTTSVTAIVGPNGSGKSNVAEALRFVLGEQSVKSLRGKRGEDLIWGGSDAVTRANRASVKIQLQNIDRSLPLDTDTITIERVVHRDGQNEYKINDHTVRLKDIHELLAAGNIGPSGHHIISQGEADRVLAASPLERRAMIEEALGLKVYQYKKQDAEKKLVKTEQNILAVSGLRREIAPHLQYLERELKKVAEARDVKAQLVEQYAEYLRREDVYLAHQYDTVSMTSATIAEKLEAATAQIAACDAALPDDTDDPPAIDESAEQAALRTAQQARSEAEQAMSRAAGRLAAVQEQLAAAEARSEVTQLPLPIVTDKWREVAAPLQSLSPDTPSQTMYDSVQQSIAAYERWLEEQDSSPSSEEVEAVTTQLAQLEKEQTHLHDVAVAAREQEVVAQAALDAVRQRARESMQAREQATKDLYEAKSLAAQLQAEQQQYQHELELIERERQGFKDELQEAVALLGRGAAQYFEYQVSDESGAPVTLEMIREEARSVQRERKRHLEKLKIRLETLGEGNTEGLEQEYTHTKERDDFLAQEVADLEASVETLQALIVDLEQQIDEQFQVGFQRIQSEFQTFFTLMFGGGKAGLELVATQTPKTADDTELEETNEDGEAPGSRLPRGVELALQLPNKRVQGLAMLSGGERALTSIALIFAMSQVHPPLFIVLDETDAALDEANSRRYGDLIEALSERSQLILITHNRETMSRAGTLYGVTMNTTGASQLLSVRLEEAVENAK